MKILNMDDSEYYNCLNTINKSLEHFDNNKIIVNKEIMSIAFSAIAIARSMGILPPPSLSFNDEIRILENKNFIKNIIKNPCVINNFKYIKNKIK